MHPRLWLALACLGALARDVAAQTTTTTTTLPPTTVSQVCALNGAPSGRRCNCTTASGTCTVSGTVSVNDGSTLDFTVFDGTSWNLVIAHGGTLDVGSGLVNIFATTLDVQPGGILQGSGGTISVTTTGNISVDVNGTTNGKIDVSGPDPLGGGEVDLTSTQGTITIAGIINANGTATTTDAGASGGTINLTAWGDVDVTAAAGNVRANSPNQGYGGNLCFQSQNGNVVVSNLVTAQGGAGGGGCIDMDAHLDVQVAGLDASSTAGQGSGGMIMITADGDITMSGVANVQGDGTTAGGDGGDICVAATGALTVGPAATMEAQGGGGGSGGCIDLSTVNGTLLAQGQMWAFGSLDDQQDVGSGGMVCLDGGPEVDVTGATDLHGPASQVTGGEFDGTATGTFNQKAAVNATGGDGLITIQAPTVSVLGAGLVTDDPQSAGEVNPIGCSALTVDAASTLSSVGPGGFNLLQGGSVAVHGTVHADPTLPVAQGTGNPCTASANCIQYVAALDVSGAAFSLAPQAEQVAVILPCVPPTTTTTLPGGTTTSTMATTTTSTTTTTTTLPLPVCGNGVLDPGEQCDDGPKNGTPASCCTSTCTLQPGGTACADDGNLCTADVCTGTADVCSHPAEPSPTCTTPTVAEGASLLLSAPGAPKPERLRFQWGKGPAVPLAAFGSPGTEATWLCVYDETGPGRWALAYGGSPSVADGGTWAGTQTGWRFKSKTGAPDGVTGVTLKAAAVPLEAKIKVQAKGNVLFAGLPLEKNPRVVAQLRTSTGACWGASFSTATKNFAAEFKAKSDPPAVCGNGVVELGEQCDDGSANGQPGDCCDASCQFVPAGAPCTDDGNLCTDDTCNGSGTCLHPFVPATGCKRPVIAGRSTLLLVAPPSPALAWRWRHGAPTALGDFGNPTATTGYAVCLYEPLAGGTFLGTGAAVPAGGVCGRGPCWHPTSTGFTYSNKAATPDGVQRLRLKDGSLPGTASITVRGLGARLPVPSLPITNGPKVTVQLRNGAGACWEADYSSALRNDAVRFRATD
ncbi:MAG TPA: hypothetical protein VKW76_06460 [Candidatus Binatia bacterium]|nr:hypothetical protein [Candidatus Binatia bacterium]